jgi:DNA-binding transcriptional MerR regulator
VTSRSYLSIGDVLTMLREEFPDVTISKIRFLESQGLVNPERSPSGYRKFFEHDVERLRWVLRQQREHFLPLKVIRDRLAEGDLGEVEVAAGVEVGVGHELGVQNGKIRQPAHAAAGIGGTGSTGASRSAGSGTVGGLPVPTATEERMTKADDEVMARILADASRRTARIPDAANDRTPLRSVPDQPTPSARGEGAAPLPPTMPGSTPRPVGAAGPAPRETGLASSSVITRRSEPRPEASTSGTAAAGSRTTEAIRPRGAAVAPTPPPGGSAGAAGQSQSAAGGGRRSTSGPTAGRPRTDSPAAASDPVAGMVTGASLTAEELCAACGLSEGELTSLQGFGLIEAVMVAGIATFDEDALTVGNLAAEFRKFGIEPRHLRLYRNAVDREMGLIEQVIIPLLRQRNPESRQRAVESSHELGNLGQTMRASLLRSALRRHVGG